MRNIRSSALSFLVQKLRISNKKALEAIANKELTINGLPATVKQEIQPSDEVKLQGEIVQHPTGYLYLLYHKPRGIESTLNEKIPNNLAKALEELPRVFPVGRLDKDSEGLLFLTNDGSLYNKIAHSESKQEKEYEVEVDHVLSEEFLEKLRQGVEIMGKRTLPAKVTATGLHTFNIVLTQGLNRQIRRMCYKSGYEVLRLKRVRIAHLQLGNLAEGEWRFLENEETNLLVDI